MNHQRRFVRNTSLLAAEEFDLLVIGGGIYGACIARDAAMRGLKVALVERADFGGATSANSLKIMHGGLRYLQDANVSLIHTMIRERRTWMEIAPHLVHPLSCLMPTGRGRPKRHKIIMAAALALNDILGYGRNRQMDDQKQLPNGRIISQSEYADLVPGLKDPTVTGGAFWHDAQAHNTERLLLSVILSAVASGAIAANYVEVGGFLLDGSHVNGVTVKDLLNGDEFEIGAKLIINATGGWTDRLLGLLGGEVTSHRFRRSIAINLVTRQILAGEHALAIPSNRIGRDDNGRPTRDSHMLFAVPWHRYSLIGTRHLHYDGPATEHPVSEDVVLEFIHEFNEAYPSAGLTRQDVYQVHAGYLPAFEKSQSSSEVKLVRQGRIHDHEMEDGIDGLITVVGVKYTTARKLAEKAVNLAMKKLVRRPVRCRTASTPICGGQIRNFDDFLSKATAGGERDLPAETIRHLIYTYGSDYSQMLAYGDENPELLRPLCLDSPVIGAEVVHACRHEMAQTLADVVFRRTELGEAGLPSLQCLRSCGELLAAELSWDLARTQTEIEKLIQASLLSGKRTAFGNKDHAQN